MLALITITKLCAKNSSSMTIFSFATNLKKHKVRFTHGLLFSKTHAKKVEGAINDANNEAKYTPGCKLTHKIKMTYFHLDL